MPVTSKVPMRVVAFPLENVRLLDGPFKCAQDLEQAYLLRVEPDRLLARFRENAGLEPKAGIYGGWESETISGHSLGHYLSACSLMYASTGDERLLEKVNYIVDELAACQNASPDGYVSGIPGGSRWYEEMARGDIRSKGFDLNDIWVPWYTLHKMYAGLLDAHRYCGSEKALRVAARSADWACEVVHPLSEEQMQEMLRCEHGGMNESFAELYARTGNEKYLELSRRFHHKEVLDPLARRIDCLPGKHGNTQIPKIIGVVRRYELTGDPTDRTIAEFFWQTVVRHHSYVTGGHGDREYFGPSDQLNDRLSPHTTETCNTYNMLKLTRHLFMLSGRASYVDYFERALYNHILASQNPDDGMTCYYVPLQSGLTKTYSTPFDTFSCCHGTGMENHSKYGESIYFHDGDRAIYVNLFIASTLDWPGMGLALRQETVFPEEPQTRLVFTCREPVELTLALRRPAWVVGDCVIRLNGEPLAVEADENGYLPIRRVWQTGDVVQFTMPMTLRTETMPDNPRRVAVLYGPIVLAGDLEESFARPVDSEAEFDMRIPVFVTEKPLVDSIEPVAGKPLQFRTVGAGRPSDVTFVPFYKMYHRHYGVYWDLFTPEQWQERQRVYEEDLQQRRRLEARTVDVLRIGEMQPERDHNLQGEKTAAGELGGRKWRHAGDGGWFSFEMKVDPAAELELSCTYWGDDRYNRTFDILVDGRKIATQTLERNEPGRFFDVVYPIPAELVQGKEKITIRLQAHPGNTAGGLFGCRLLRREP